MRRVNIECDFGRVNFQREPDTALLEDIENRVPAIGELLESGIDHRLRRGGKVIDQMPDTAAGEAVDHADAELLSSPGGVLHLFRSTAVHAVGIPITPHVGRQNHLMTGIDIVADSLTDEVVRDRK